MLSVNKTNLMEVGATPLQQFICDDDDDDADFCSALWDLFVFTRSVWRAACDL